MVESREWSGGLIYIVVGVREKYIFRFAFILNHGINSELEIYKTLDFNCLFLFCQ